VRGKAGGGTSELEIYIVEHAWRNYVRLGGMRLPTISQPAVWRQQQSVMGWGAERQSIYTRLLLFFFFFYFYFSSFFNFLFIFDFLFFYFFIFFLLSKITYSKRARLFIITGFCGARCT